VSQRERDEAEAIFTSAQNLDKIYKIEMASQVQGVGVSEVSAQVRQQIAELDE
jgi:hypothetical protein